MILPVHLYIESVIRTVSDEGVGIYVVYTGDKNRGDIYVKTYADSDKTACVIHNRAYDFIRDSYQWDATAPMNESDADIILQQKHQQDTDCWCIEIESKKNYFKDVL